MPVTRLIELYEQSKCPDFTVELDAVMELAVLRKRFFPTVSSVDNETQVELFRQLLRECTDPEAYRLSPTHFLTLKKKPITQVTRAKFYMEMNNAFRKTYGTQVKNAYEALDRLLPLDSPEDYHRCLAFIYCFISSRREMHVVKEQEPTGV